MRTIHRYDVPIVPDNPYRSGGHAHTASMVPAGATILHCGVAASTAPEHVSVWALVDTDNELEQRRLFVVGTGHDIDATRSTALRGVRIVPIGTVIDHRYDRRQVWHVLEEVSWG